MSIDKNKVEELQNNGLAQPATDLVESLVQTQDKKKSKKSKKIFDGSTEVFAKKIPNKTYSGFQSYKAQ